MMSTDYPYEDFSGSVSFVRDNLKLSDEEKRATLCNNAIALGFSKLSPVGPTSINNVKQYNGQKNGKFNRDKHIVIQRNGDRYNVMGQKIK